MKSKKIYVRILACFVATVFFGLVSSANSAYAEIDSSKSSRDNVILKAKFTELVEQCYKGGGIKDYLQVEDFYNASAIVSTQGLQEGFVKLPTGLTNFKNDAATCSELLNGSKLIGVSDGLLSIAKDVFGQSKPTPFPPSASSSIEDKRAYLVGMGYTEDTYAADNAGDGEQTKCLDIKWKNANTNAIDDNYTTRICLRNLHEDGAIVVSNDYGLQTSVEIKPGSKALDLTTQFTTPATCANANGGVRVFMKDFRDNTISYNDFCLQTSGQSGNKAVDNWDDFVEAVGNIILIHDNQSGIYNSKSRDRYIGITDYQESQIDNSGKILYYIQNGFSVAGNKALTYLTNGHWSNVSFLDLTEADKLVLLQEYLANVYEAKLIRCEKDIVDSATANDFYERYYTLAQVYNDGEVQKCYIDVNSGKKDKTVYGYNNSNYFSRDASWRFDEVISRINNLNVKSTDIASSGITILNSDSNHVNPSDYTEDPGVLDGCFNASGALGWIVCPVIRVIGVAVDGIYDGVASNYLSMNSATIQSTGLAQAWNGFQVFANIIFVILLLVVIISQVTGIGISNYGIKKVLPRLIITAVLVNLSFIICAIAADLSNITGSGFNDMLQNIKIDTLTGDDVSFGKFTVNTIASIGTVGAPIAIAGTAIAFTVKDGGWSALIMPLLIGFIIAFFAILFFFVLLAVRKAAIVILIAISPIAIVCYALPNTQKFFSRWLKMFSGMLLVYPICGLLMGGGNFASRLLLVTAGNAGFIYYLVCMLLSVVPFFFIPSLLKNSMSVLGSIGNKIAGMGSRWGNMATGALRRSRWAQDHQQEIARNIDMNRSKRIQARNQKVLDRLNRKRTNPNDVSDLSGLSSRERKRYTQATLRNARATSALDRRHREEVEAANIAEYYTDEMLQNQEATAKRKYRENMVDSFADGTISSGIYNRSDGTTGNVDINDPNDIQGALINLAQDVRDNPDDKLAIIRMEGMMEIAKRKGSKGRQAIVNALHNIETHGGADAARKIAQRLLLDDRTMAAFHSNGVGTEKYIQDLASGSGTKDRSHYAMESIEGLKLENVGDLEDAAQDDINELYNEIVSLSNSGSNPSRLNKLKEAYEKAVGIMVQAANDPRYAGRIKSKDGQGIINKHAEQLYNLERDELKKDPAKLSQLTVTDASNVTHSAEDVDGDDYLTDVHGTRLVDANGNNVKFNDAYSDQIKAFQTIKLGQGGGATEVSKKIPHDIPFTYDAATNQYRAENDLYVTQRQSWNSSPDVARLTGYDATSGTAMNAAGVDTDGFLIDGTGNRLVDSPGGAALKANDAYDNQIYNIRRTDFIASNISQLEGYNSRGQRVHATGVDSSGFLVGGNGQRLKTSRHGAALSANDAYDIQIGRNLPSRFRDLRPDEQRLLDKLLDYNAEINVPH